MTIQIEICIEHVASAVAAQQGGAHRLELCSDLLQGGLTPSLGFVEQVHELVDLDLMVMIRPRPGDFLYSNDEFEVMKRDIVHVGRLGVQGVVFGLLKSDGQINRKQTAELIQAARPMQVTVHRAFDFARDPFEALDLLLELGVERVLTSGQGKTAVAGLDLLRQLQARAGDALTILPAGGINAQNGKRILTEAALRELHIGSGVKEQVFSQMAGRPSGVQVGGANAPEESSWVQVSVERVRELVTAVADTDTKVDV